MPARPDSPGPPSGGARGRRLPAGDEPLTARSALGIRLILGVVFIPLFAAAAALFAQVSAGAAAHGSPSPGEWASLSGICAALALFAAVDLTVVLRRRRERKAGSGGRAP